MEEKEAARIFLVGIGMGNEETLCNAARQKIMSASLVIGARRMIESAGKISSAEKFESYDAQKILARIIDFINHDESQEKSCCVLFSGDTGFFSGADGLSKKLSEAKITFEIIPGFSSVQYFSAKIKRPYQNWNIVSLHATSAPFLPEIMSSKETFFLLGGKISAKEITEELFKNYFSGKITVAFNLGLQEEKIISILASLAGENQIDTKETCKAQLEALEKYSGEKLCVMLVENYGFISRTQGALPDEAFIRSEKVPMTKRIVRSAILSLLSPADGETIWDIGSGTGAVSIDIARSCKCMVFAVEEKKSAIETQVLNKKKHGALNMSITEGKAPESLDALPTPDAVFVGGSGGELRRIIDKIQSKNSAARILVSAVTLETLCECERIAAEKGMEIEATQISAARTTLVGRYHMIKAENPVWLVSLAGKLAREQIIQRDDL